MFFTKSVANRYTDFIKKIVHLQNERSDPVARILSYDFERLKEQVEQALNEEEFTPTNMFDANRIPLSMLKKGEVFHGVSAIINPYDWAHDPALLLYKDANEKAAKKGVNIERTFVLQRGSDVEAMRPIMDDQIEMGVDVRYILESDLKTLSYFPDFTVIPKFDLAIYVPNLQNLKICVVKRDPQLCEDLMKDYRVIQRYVKKWDGLGE